MLSVAESVEIGGARVPLFGHANVWIEDSVENRSSIEQTQDIIRQGLLDTFQGQLEVVVFDDALTGLSAPFEALNSGGERILTTLHDVQEFKGALGYLREHIQGVNNVMQGRADNLVEFRALVEYPVESFKLIVVSSDVSLLDEDTLNQLSILLKAGPRAGVSFLIHSVEEGVEYLTAMCEFIDRTDERALNPGISISAPDLIASSEQLARSLVTTSMDPIEFTAAQPLDSTWSQSSADGISFAVGKYGLNTVEITLGDELNQRHNMLITGAVGQGKSNLISVVIHSLCERYGPEELQLYLLDFKEGVTLQAFFDTDTGEYLPHARVLGLEADREFGLSVFKHLYSVYQERMQQFKAAGVQNIKQFRAQMPSEAMPRILLVVDEFQMMFAEKDSTSDEIADRLVKAVRLFRASGIHIVLASQTIGGNIALMGSAGDGLFGQVPVRIALKNSLTESHATLGVKNDAAAYLRAREAIVNLEYGDLSDNRKTSIAFADEAVLGPIRTDWWKRGESISPPPYMFMGEEPRSLRSDSLSLKEIVGDESNERSVLLGSKIEVDARPLALPFGRDVGRNIAIVGAGDAVVEVLNVALSLAIQEPGSQFVVLDMVEHDAAWLEHSQSFKAAVESFDCSVEIKTKPEVQEYLAAAAAAVTMHIDSPDQRTFILGLGLDRCREMPTDFPDLCRTGPIHGTHLIGWWSKLDSFRDQIGYGGDSSFDIRIALRLDPPSAKQLVNDPLLEWKASENRALAWDSAEMTEPIRFIPYTLFDSSVCSELSKQ